MFFQLNITLLAGSVFHLETMKVRVKKKWTNYAWKQASQIYTNGGGMGSESYQKHFL